MAQPLTPGDFLRLILPTQGFKHLRIIMPSGAYIPRWFEGADFEAMAQAALQFDAKGATVYHACAAFTTNQSRKQENAAAAAAFWIDIDVRPDKGYTTMREAGEALKQFVAALGLTQPLIVFSGGGLHVYWRLEQPVTAVQWVETATLLKRATNTASLRADPTRTADIASVLRTIGTHNHKRGKTVQLVQTGDVSAYDEFHAALVAYLDANNVSTIVALHADGNHINSDLDYDPRYEPSSAHVVATHCAQIRHIRDTKGNVEYPLWWAGIGLLKHCTEGDALIHSWSQGHPRYSQEETQKKIESWTHGPTTCQRFKDDNPAGCTGCPHTVTSPIQLGELPPVVVQQADADGDPFAGMRPADGAVSLPALPASYRFDDRFYLTDKGLKVAVTEQPDKNQPPVTTYEIVSDTPLWGVAYYRTPTGYAIKFRSLVSKRTGRGDWMELQEFDISCSAIAAGGRSLFEQLGQHMVATKFSQRRAMEQYLLSWMEELKQKADEVLRYGQFGWQSDHSFLLGNKLYQSDGSSIDVVLSPDTTGKYEKFYAEKGDLHNWVQLVDLAYNYEGQEQFQFIVAAGFGAPLMGLFPSDNNLILNMLSPVGGRGKTTNAQVAMSIWGNPTALKNNSGSTTVRAVKELVTISRHLPVLMDEITPKDAKAQSQLLYDFSSGSPAQALKQDGTLRRSDMLPWGTFMFTSANKSMVDTLAAAQPGSDAELLRMFEYYVQPTSTLSKSEADALFSQLLSDHYGVAGRVYVQYLTTHYDEVVKLVQAAHRNIDQLCDFTGRDRFLSTGLACIIAGAALAKKLALIRFDIGKLREWIVQQVGLMQIKVRSTLRSDDEMFGQMLNELAEGFLITDQIGDARAGSCTIEQRARGHVVGRVVRATNEAWLDVNAARRWCIDNRVDFTTLQAYLRKAGLIGDKLVRLSLLKGTGLSGTPVSCWQLSQEAVIRTQDIGQKVVLLNRAQSQAAKQ